MADCHGPSVDDSCVVSDSPCRSVVVVVRPCPPRGGPLGAASPSTYDGSSHSTGPVAAPPTATGSRSSPLATVTKNNKS